MECYEEQKCKMFCNRQDFLDYCMGYVNVLRQACRAIRNSFLKFVKMGYYYNIVILQQGVPDYVSETGHCRYCPERGTEMETASMLKLFNRWLTLVGRRTILLMPEK